MLNVLYVEDDPASREVIRMASRMNPGQYEVTIFDDSHDFEQRLGTLEPKPELILLDIHMEPVSGFEMLDMIRSKVQYDDTPVVALTASVMNEEIQMLQDAGFQGVLSKPLNIDEFPELIERIIQGENIWYIW